MTRIHSPAQRRVLYGQQEDLLEEEKENDAHLDWLGLKPLDGLCIPSSEGYCMVRKDLLENEKGNNAHMRPGSRGAGLHEVKTRDDKVNIYPEHPSPPPLPYEIEAPTPNGVRTWVHERAFLATRSRHQSTMNVTRQSGSILGIHMTSDWAGLILSRLHHPHRFVYIMLVFLNSIKVSYATQPSPPVASLSGRCN